MRENGQGVGMIISLDDEPLAIQDIKRRAAESKRAISKIKARLIDAALVVVAILIIVAVVAISMPTLEHVELSGLLVISCMVAPSFSRVETLSRLRNEVSSLENAGDEFIFDVARCMDLPKVQAYVDKVSLSGRVSLLVVEVEAIFTFEKENDIEIARQFASNNAGRHHN